VELTRWRDLGLVALLSAVASWAACPLVAERWPTVLTFPWTASALLFLVGAGVLWAAWPVRQYARQTRPWTDPLRAARVCALARACSRVAALLGGCALGVVIHAAATWATPAGRDRVLLDSLAIVAALALAIAGVLAETWCRLPPPTDDDGTPPTSSPAPA